MTILWVYLAGAVVALVGCLLVITGPCPTCDGRACDCDDPLMTWMVVGIAITWPLAMPLATALAVHKWMEARRP